MMAGLCCMIISDLNEVIRQNITNSFLKLAIICLAGCRKKYAQNVRFVEICLWIMLISLCITEL